VFERLETKILSPSALHRSAPARVAAGGQGRFFTAFGVQPVSHPGTSVAGDAAGAGAEPCGSGGTAAGWGWPWHTWELELSGCLAHDAALQPLQHPAAEEV